MSIIKHKTVKQLVKESSTNIFIHRDTLYNRFIFNRQAKHPQSHLNQTAYKRASTLQVFKEQNYSQISSKKVNFYLQMNFKQTTKSINLFKNKFKTQQNPNSKTQNIKNHQNQSMNFNNHFKSTSNKNRIRNRIITRNKFIRNQSYCTPNEQYNFNNTNKNIYKNSTALQLQFNQKHQLRKVKGLLQRDKKRIHSEYLNHNKSDTYGQPNSRDHFFKKLKNDRNRLCQTDNSLQQYVIQQIQKSRYIHQEIDDLRTKRKEVLIIGNNDFVQKQQNCLNLIEVNLQTNKTKQPIKLKFNHQIENKVGPWSKKSPTQHEQFLLCI